MPVRALSLAFATLLCATACTTTGSGNSGTAMRAPPGSENETTLPPSPPAAPPTSDAAACHLDAARAYVGKPADEATVAAVKQASGATGEVRVIKPGQAVTMDYRADRLNIHLDAGGAIERVDCG